MRINMFQFTRKGGDKSKAEPQLHSAFQSIYEGGSRRFRDANAKPANTEPQLHAKVQSIYKGAIVFSKY